jgi:hypothetical protein
MAGRSLHDRKAIAGLGPEVQSPRPRLVRVIPAKAGIHLVPKLIRLRGLHVACDPLRSPYGTAVLLLFPDQPFNPHTSRVVRRQDSQ